MSERIGNAIAVRRLELGFTAQQLAERCKELGAPIHRTTITKIERGRPRFDLGELVVLAAALNTSPATLLYRWPYDNPVDVLPGLEVSKFDAAQWFSAMAEIAAVEPQAWSDDTRSLKLTRELERMQRLRNAAIQTNATAGDLRQIAFYDEQIIRITGDLHSDAERRIERLRPALDRSTQAREEAAKQLEESERRLAEIELKRASVAENLVALLSTLQKGEKLLQEGLDSPQDQRAQAVAEVTSLFGAMLNRFGADTPEQAGDEDA